MVVVSPPKAAPPVVTPPPDLYVCPFTIAVDTREQAPWTFQTITIGGRQRLVKRQVGTLATGDYSICGYEDYLTIERKSAEDFLGSITARNTRFRREHERMAAMVAAGGFAAVVVEGCLAAICDELDGGISGRKMSSETVLGITAAWPQRYHVHWLFAGDRRRAELLAFRMMWKWWDVNNGGNRQ